MRKFHRNKVAVYEYDGWKIIEKEFREDIISRSEAVFSLGNGYIGARGNFEEGYSGNNSKCFEGTYINGIYEAEPIHYWEYHFGYPTWSQTMVNVTDWKSIELWIGDERFDMLKGEVTDYSRILDMQKGTLTRKLKWRSPKGREIYLEIDRFVSFDDKHLAAIRYSFIPLNFNEEITLYSGLDGDVRNKNLKEKALYIQELDMDYTMGYILHNTNNTKFSIGCAMYNDFYGDDDGCEYRYEECKEEKKVQNKFSIKAKNGKKYTLDKYVAFYTSRDICEDKIIEKAKLKVQNSRHIGYDKLLEKHTDYLKVFWKDADIVIKGDIALQQGIRFNMFHLLQSTGQDGFTAIGAKGLTGEGYEGHYFWDTEIYVLPFFLYSRPEIAKALLMFRYNTLDKARIRARELGLRGSLFPWRTINGEEASTFFPASTAQVHINADICYAIHKYVEATQDYDFLADCGAEIVFESARMWVNRGGYIPFKDNKFCINEVTGPDEYTACVNNNCYTNYLARFNLYYALKIAKLLKEKYGDKYEKLVSKIKLRETELEEWKRAADKMYLPYCEELGINPQDDSYLFKETYDVDSIPENEIPLVSNWHQLNIWRYQIAKQADVVLLMFLLSEEFPLALKKKNYDFYEPRTIHDSSLSSSVFSIIASEIRYKEQAYNYFMQTARMDLDDYNNNAHEGVHTACMAGTWACVVNGFAGMRVFNDILHFKPYLPDKWQGYQFKIKFKGRQIDIRIDSRYVTYTLINGDDTEIWHYDKKIRLTPNNKVKMEIDNDYGFDEKVQKHA